MKRYAIEFSYSGKNYFGYQIQPHQISVQEVLEKALSTLLRTPIKTIGAGRTDTGVNAKKIFAHFDSPTPLLENFAHRLNSFLPSDISVRRVFEVHEDFHARFDALYRTYQYHISLEKNPFLEDFSWQIYHKKINIEAMNQACEILMKYEDFSCFAKTGTDNKTNLCKIYSAQWTKKNNELIFTISANRFLRNMVRSIVGTLVEIGFEKISPEKMHEIILSKNRNKAGSSAPAQGLFLVDVGYHFKKNKVKN